jgi:hypothetical protein
MERMQGDWESHTITAEELLAEFGITKADLDDVEVEFE